VAVGNLQKFLPFILSEVKNQPKRQYLLLHSLREIISRTAGVEVLLLSLSLYRYIYFL
jgi:cullin-associated NEDD8-dissociated protein 1